MVKRRTPRVVFAACLAAAVAAFGIGWLLLRPRGPDLGAIRSRVEPWGGGVRRWPDRQNSLAPLRPWVGDNLVDWLSDSPGTVVTAQGSAATAPQLAELLAAEPFFSVSTAGTKRVGDDWVAGIRKPSAVQFLYLDGTGITDRSVDRISEMDHLVTLGLVDTAVSDAAVARLGSLRSLDRLDVGGPNIRSIRLEALQVVDDLGRPAVRSSPAFRVEGRVRVALHLGKPSNVRLMVASPGGRPPWMSNPYGWNSQIGRTGSLVEESPGTWTFRVDLPGIPPGPSSVEVWVDIVRVARPHLIHYRMEPRPIDLAPPEPGGSSPEATPGR